MTLDAAGDWKKAISAALARSVKTLVEAGRTEPLESLTIGVATLGPSSAFVINTARHAGRGTTRAFAASGTGPRRGPS